MNVYFRPHGSLTGIDRKIGVGVQGLLSYVVAYIKEPGQRPTRPTQQ